jgi:subtilisin family serine protease
MTSITYRGNTVSATTTTGAGGTLYGTIGRPNGGTGVHGYRYSAEEANIQSCILAGVIVIGSAGNDYHKIDVSTGTDYNNYYSGASIGSWYYHRGSSPGSSDGVICVGAISVTTPEHKNNFSSTGPRVDVYAPGNSILGSWKSASYTAAIQDPRNTAYYLDKVTGTSQSAPQVTGVVALLLQARPWMTNTDVLKFVQAVSAKNLLDETYYGQSGTYTNFASLQGSGNRYLYWPFNQSNPMTIG